MPVVKRLPDGILATDSVTEQDKKDLLEKIEREQSLLEANLPTASDIEADFSEIESFALEQRQQSLQEYKYLIEKTRDIPLEKLIISREGCDVFDLLCLRIDINQKCASILPQWRDVADLLEVDRLRTQWIETCVRPREGLTRAMLEIYMKDGGTLGEVLEALLKLECLDILEALRQSVRDYVTLFESKKIEAFTPSDSPLAVNDKFFSVLRTLASALGKDDPCRKLQLFSSGLKQQCGENAITVQHSVLVQGEGTGSPNYDPPPQYPGDELPKYRSDLHFKKRKDLDGPAGMCRILLLFAEDGVPYSEQAYNLLQGFNHKGVTAEVFRLNEESLWYELLTNPEACCMKWANEVDYVVPILTPKFLQEAHSGEINIDSLLPTSPIINRYMYTLLRARYTEESCRNTMVRPVIPDEFLRSVSQCTAVKRDPLFRLVWTPMVEDRVTARLRGMLAECAKRMSG